jgi:hypothetical protein
MVNTPNIVADKSLKAYPGLIQSLASNKALPVNRGVQQTGTTNANTINPFQQFML